MKNESWDPGRDFPKATRITFFGRNIVHHNACGGRIYEIPMADLPEYRCDGCKAWWGPRFLNQATDDQFAVRFHVRGEKDNTRHVLVWKSCEVTRMHYSTLIPETEADKNERVRF